MVGSLKKGLGRGLSSLLGDATREIVANKVSINDISRNKLQPRKHHLHLKLRMLKKMITTVNTRLYLK